VLLRLENEKHSSVRQCGPVRYAGYKKLSYYINGHIYRRGFVFIIFGKLQQLLINVNEIRMRLRLEQPTRFAHTAAVGEAFFYFWIFTQQQLTEFAGGLELTYTISPGEYVGMGAAVGHKTPL
jgi:hypothetical protein